jgi:glycosyltransferase involved in cell wall biosynthesis
VQPDLSVDIPTYNREEYLRGAIASCFAENEGVSVEVVVVDDGSTDGTRTYLEELDEDRVRTIFREHQGGQVGRNRGLSEAKGEYVKFLDDDDWLAASALAREVGALQRTGADVCVGTYQSVNA